MAVIKTIGKLAPGAYKQMIDHLTRRKIKNPFIKTKDIVVNKKPEVEQTEMFNRFNQANPRQDMAGGGRMGFYKGELVTKGDKKGQYVIRNVPESISKTRTIYFPNETAMNEWLQSRPGRGRKDFGKFETGAQFKDTIQPKNLEKLKKLEEIINKSNSQYKKSLTSKAALQLAGFKEGYQSIATTGKLREEVRKLIGTLQSTGDKMDNYINNVMLSEDALVKDFQNPMRHLQKKFGVSSGFTDKWAQTSQAVKDNKRLFNNLANALSFNKYKQYADGTPRLMSDFSVIVQNKLPSSTPFMRGDSPEKFILQSAYRHFKYNKEVGKASKITFIGNPDLLPINEWKFIKGGKLFSLDPAEDTIKFQGKNYKNNYLNRVDAKDIYKNDFGDVYKIFDDLETYMNSTTTIGNKDVKLDTILRRKLFDATGKKNYLLRRAVDIDHLDINKDPFSNLRLLDRRTNVQAGLLKRLPKYKNNPKLLNKVLTDIGYTTPYKDVDTFIKRTTRNIDTPIKIIGNQTLKPPLENLDLTKNKKSQAEILRKMGFKCKYDKADGGRIGLSTGSGRCDDPASYTDDINKTRQDLKSQDVRVRADAQAKLTKGLDVAKTLPKIGTFLRRVGQATVGGVAKTLQFLGVTSPIGIALEGIVEGGIYDYFKAQGYTDQQALSETFFPGIISGRPEGVPWYGGAEKLFEKELTEVREKPTILDDGTIVPGQIIEGAISDPKILQYQKALEDQEQVFDAFARKQKGEFTQRKDIEDAASADIRDLNRSGTISRINRILNPESMASQAYQTAVERQQAGQEQRARDYKDRFYVQREPSEFMQNQLQKERNEAMLQMFPPTTVEQVQNAYIASGLGDVLKTFDAQDYRDEMEYGDFLQKQNYFADNFRFEKAGGGIAKIAGVDQGPPPESGPNSQGLPSLKNRVRNL